MTHWREEKNEIGILCWDFNWIKNSSISYRMVWLHPSVFDAVQFKEGGHISLISVMEGNDVQECGTM